MTLRGVMRLLACFTWPHVRRRPLRHALSLVSIALAVALSVSMRATHGSLLHAFQQNLDALAGRADCRITAFGLVGPETLAAVERVPGVRAAPLVTGMAVIEGVNQGVTVAGIDPLRDPRVREYQPPASMELDLPALMSDAGAVIVSSRLAEQNGWQLGSNISLVGARGAHRCRVAGILPRSGLAALHGGNVVIAPLPLAQRILDRPGRFDRIDVRLEPPASVDALRAAAGPGCLIDPARARDPTFEYLYSQFQVALASISLIAALIGLFIVYNAVSLSVVERAREIGILRALGAGRAQVLAEITIEAAVVGLAASALGVPLGKMLVRMAIDQVSATMTILMDVGYIDSQLPGDVWLLGPGIGVLAAVAGALAPGHAAATLPPVAAIKSEALGTLRPSRARLAFFASMPTLAACIVLVQHPRTEWAATVAGLGVGFMGLAMAGPQLLAWLSKPALALTRRLPSFSVTLALDNILKFPSRSSLTLVAFGGSLSLVVAMSTLMRSLEADVIRWFDDIFVFDLSVQCNDLSASPYPSKSFPDALRREALADPECLAAAGVRLIFLPYSGDEVMLIAYEVAPFQQLRIERGISRDPAADRRAIDALRRGGIGISANFARLHGVGVGDSIRLPTPAGPREFPVASVQVDHSWFRGVLFMDLDVYRDIWKDDRLSYLDVFTRPGVDVERYRAKLARRWSAAHHAFVHRTDELRAHGLRLIREWFKLADVQLLLAVIIGGVGVANTMLISVLTQTRQIGLLRAVGAAPRHIRSVLALEGAALGLLGGLLGVVLGLVTTVVLLYPMALKLTGVELPFVPPVRLVAAAPVAAVLFALAASVLPIRAARGINVVAAIGYE